MTSLKSIPTNLLRRLRLRCEELSDGDTMLSKLSSDIHRELHRRAKGGKVKSVSRPVQILLQKRLLNPKTAAFNRILPHQRK